jgi:putative methionine-R-sulfoxide reductase with GAF domain
LPDEIKWKAEILSGIVQAITTGPQTEVKEVLINLKKALRADDVHFRPIDWRGKDVINVPDWSTDRESVVTSGKSATEKKDELDPRLYNRTFFNSEKPKEIDCVVGLVARISRIQEYELSGKDQHTLDKLRASIDSQKIKEPRYLFNRVTHEAAFGAFIRKLGDSTRALTEQSEEWAKFYDSIKDIKIDPQVFEEIEKRNPPWKRKENPRREVETEQWKKLYEELLKKTAPYSSLIERIKQTAEYYSNRQAHWEAYLKKARQPRSEIAVPVYASGKLFGVLNLHKELDFNEADVEVSRNYAALLALVCLRKQVGSLENLQKISEVMAGESSLEKIASEIARGIRTALAGIPEEDIYPLLYTCKRPLSTRDELKNFGSIWEYQEREKPPAKDKKDRKIWKHEQDLGPIPIRPNGLGHESICAWKAPTQYNEPLQARKYFKVAGDVNNPNSHTGSRNALLNDIKTTGCLPLIFNDQVYGLAYIHCNKYHFFTEIELEALETLGTQAAIAINNAKSGGPTYAKLYGNALINALLKKG